MRLLISSILSLTLATHGLVASADGISCNDAFWQALMKAAPAH